MDNDQQWMRSVSDTKPLKNSRGSVLFFWSWRKRQLFYNISKESRIAAIARVVGLYNLSSNLRIIILCLISYNTSHKFWDQSPFPHYQCSLQISETVSWHKLLRCYSPNMVQHWVRSRGLIYFCKVDHSRISRNFSRNWVGHNNLSEILSQNFRKLGK